MSKKILSIDADLAGSDHVQCSKQNKDFQKVPENTRKTRCFEEGPF